MSTARRAFALREACTVTVLAGVGLALFSTMAAFGRGQSRLQVCSSRLKTIGKLSASYAADHQDQIANLKGFSGMSHWRSLSDQFYPDSSSGEMSAVADAAVDIIRVRGNRPDIGRIGSSWLPNAAYGTLVLADYAGQALPSPEYACPEDANLLAWQSDPEHFNNLGVPSPVLPGVLDNASRRWPYTSSYLMPSATWTNDHHDSNRRAWYFQNAQVFSSIGGHTPGQTDLGHRRYAQVAFPAAKVHSFDRGSRHFTPRAVYWGFANAKQPLLYFDGVVRTSHPGGSNPGWDWSNPQSPGSFHYAVNFADPLFQWHPGRPEGVTQNVVEFPAAYWSATRDGLAGRDTP